MRSLGAHGGMLTRQRALVEAAHAHAVLASYSDAHARSDRYVYGPPSLLPGLASLLGKFVGLAPLFVEYWHGLPFHAVSLKNQNAKC